MKKIITHSGPFHSDEVTACALLQVFTDDVFDIKRIAHQADIPDADFVLDIGRKYDGVKYFDHHQRDRNDPMFELSSAGLIWRYLDVVDTYPKIGEFIRLIDHHDTGIRKASSFEYPSIISAFNTDDIYNDDVQELAFIDALHTARRVIESMKEYQDKLNDTEQYLIARYDSLNHYERAHGVLIADGYQMGWNKYLNGQTTPDLRCITWPKDDGSDEWQAQVIPSIAGDYGLHGDGFKQDESMIFVHSGEFFCVAKDKETMMDYLAKA